MNELIPNAETKPAKIEQPDFGELANSPSVSMWLKPENFAHMQRLANMFSSSGIVPKHFQGETANCMIALSFAFRMGLDPMFAFQNLYVVYGNPGMSAQLMITLANKSGVFVGPIEFEVSGDGEDTSVTAIAELAGNHHKVTDTITLKQARAAGWTKAKEGEKPMWKARPIVMLRYRAAASLIRAYAPEALNGMLIDDEISDDRSMIDITDRTQELIPQQTVTNEVGSVEPTRQIAKTDIQETHKEDVKSGKTADSSDAETIEPEASWEF